MCGVASAVDLDAGVQLGGDTPSLPATRQRTADGVAHRTLGQASLADVVARANHTGKAGSDLDEM